MTRSRLKLVVAQGEVRSHTSMLHVMYYSVLAVHYISYMMYYTVHYTIHSIVQYIEPTFLIFSFSLSVCPKLEEFTRKERQGVFSIRSLG